jgi:pyruvate ferredoxin oxidoreductase alpha subunit
MDGFILTHAYERIDLPEQDQVDGFLPPFEPQQRLDPDHPVSIGAMVGPEAFSEVRYINHHKQLEALGIIEEQAGEFAGIFGRDTGGLVKTYWIDDAETIVVTMGSVIGTFTEVIAGLREEGHAIGALSIRSFRPFPRERLKRLLSKAERIVVFEKDLMLGMGGVLSMHIQLAIGTYTIPVYSVIGGLGGRPITRQSLRGMLEQAFEDRMEQTTVLDLDRAVVDRELAREHRGGRSGPAAENILKDIGVGRAAETG